MNNSLSDPFLSKPRRGSVEFRGRFPQRELYIANSDEKDDVLTSPKYTEDDMDHDPSHIVSYSHSNESISDVTLSTEVPISSDLQNVDIFINEDLSTSKDINPINTWPASLLDDPLPDDIIGPNWRNTMEELLDFDAHIDDKALIRKLQHQSYAARSLQLQQIVEFLPQSIAEEIISYELSKKSIEIFIRRSISNNVVNKVDVKASLSGWTLTLMGIYLFFCGLNLFQLIDCIPSEKVIYVIGNYTPSGWRIELSVVLGLCTIHFMNCIGHYNTGRRWSRKLKRIKNVLDFGDPIETTAYIPVMRWMGFPFIEAFNLNLRWFVLLGFKYWIMVSVFIVLCLPLWLIQHEAMKLIVSIPSCILCCIGAWLLYIVQQNTNSLHSALVDLVKIFVMTLVVFAMLYGIVLVYHDHHFDESKHHHTSLLEDKLARYGLNGNFSILNLCLSGLFLVVLLSVELWIINSWKSVNVRYNYFGWQLLASVLIVMIFGVLKLSLFALVAALFVLYNAAIIWNDQMHKKIMQSTYGLSKVEYVEKYRPIYNTDTDSEWLTTPYTICCKKDCIKKCRGRWVINCYAGLVTGRITTPTCQL